MPRRKIISAVGISMLDLISNALAAVIILFFILVSSKFPTFPPVRVCGTLIIEFRFKKNDENDRSRSFVMHNSPDGVNQISNNSNSYQFDSSILKLNESINHSTDIRFIEKCYEITSKDQPPAIRSYRTKDESITKHTIIIRSPVEGNWTIGLLYTNHLKLLDIDQPDSVYCSAIFYDNKQVFSRNDTLIVDAPTSSISTKINFNNVTGNVEKFISKN